jgi:hypothetical protein
LVAGSIPAAGTIVKVFQACMQCVGFGGYWAAMADCIYRRTPAGKSAWDEGAPLAPPLRRMLGLIDHDIHSKMLPKLLRQHTQGVVAEWALQLQKLGLIESLPVLDEHNLDFTDTLRAAQS